MSSPDGSGHSPSSKPDSYLAGIAGEVLARTVRSMPPELAKLAGAIPVIFEAYADRATIDQGFEPDILGLFVGEVVGSSSEGSSAVPACIILYVESIWDFCDGDLHLFRRELRLTFLHELGHYLGWDEDQVAAHGLE